MTFVNSSRLYDLNQDAKHDRHGNTAAQTHLYPASLLPSRAPRRSRHPRPAPQLSPGVTCAPKHPNYPSQLVLHSGAHRTFMENKSPTPACTGNAYRQNTGKTAPEPRTEKGVFHLHKEICIEELPMHSTAKQSILQEKDLAFGEQR